MATINDKFENVKAVILSVHKNTTTKDKVGFYDTWAEKYDQDVAVLDYRAPNLAANTITSHFHGDRDAAVVLDVACGTGLVAKELKCLGFGHFVGLDGSGAMLEMAKNTGLYQDLKLCLMGDEHLPVEFGTFDVVVIAGALSVGQVPVKVVRELCMATKPGGYTCMTTRSNLDNLEYKASLERQMKALEEQGLWSCVKVVNVDQWERAVSDHEEGYISGSVYLFKRLS